MALCGEANPQTYYFAFKTPSGGTLPAGEIKHTLNSSPSTTSQCLKIPSTQWKNFYVTVRKNEANYSAFVDKQPVPSIVQPIALTKHIVPFDIWKTCGKVQNNLPLPEPFIEKLLND